MEQQTTRRRARFGARLALVSLGLTAVGIAATAGISEAHTPVITHSCDGGLTVGLTFYDPPASNNLLTVTIDGVVLTPIPFAAGLTVNFPWDRLQNHTYTVVIDANRSPGNPKPTTYDKTFTGSQTRCPEETTPPPTTPPSESSTTTTTTAPPESTTTTTVESEAPVPTSTTTTAVAGGNGSSPSTTALVAVEAPLPRAPSVTAAKRTTALPATGTDTGSQLALAMAVLVGGIGLIMITRRRRRFGAPES